MSMACLVTRTENQIEGCKFILVQIVITICYIVVETS